MFETLEEMREKSQRPLGRGMALFMYGFDCVGGLFYIIFGGQRHQSVAVLVGAVVFLLSSFWFVATMISPVRVNRRDVWVRGQIVLCILMAYQVAYTVAR